MLPVFLVHAVDQNNGYLAMGVEGHFIGDYCGYYLSVSFNVIQNFRTFEASGSILETEM